jgi:hypothetical protein
LRALMGGESQRLLRFYQGRRSKEERRREDKLEA